MFINLKEEKLNILVTGGAGFIGSCLIRKLLDHTNNRIFNLDKISYASNFDQIEKSPNLKNYNFIKADLLNQKKINSFINDSKPDIIFHLAAESHVDRSIEDSKPFIESNIIGTYNLLETTKKYWCNLDKSKEKLSDSFM